MKAFVDTNILLDYLVYERIHGQDAQIIFEGARQNLYNLVITTQSIIDAAYIVKKAGSSCAETEEFIDWLTLHINMDSIDSHDIREALNSEMPDFEDNAQFAHAESSNCDYLITNDKEMFGRKSSTGMIIMSSEQFVSLMQQR